MCFFNMERTTCQPKLKLFLVYGMLNLCDVCSFWKENQNMLKLKSPRLSSFVLLVLKRNVIKMFKTSIATSFLTPFLEVYFFLRFREKFYWTQCLWLFPVISSIVLLYSLTALVLLQYMLSLQTTSFKLMNWNVFALQDVFKTSVL